MTRRPPHHAAALVALLLAGCPKPPPPPAAPVEPAAPPIALEHVCTDALPLPERTIGALARLLHRINPQLTVEVRPCRAGTAWPIAYATSLEAPRPPIDFTVLKMEGDALLTFDHPKDPDAATVNLCADLDLRLDATHRVRAIALWDGNDEGAFDPRAIDASRATLAWIELLSRTPSRCALGEREAPGETGERWLSDAVRCATLPLVILDRRGCDASAPTPPATGPEPTLPAARAVHRFHGEGRTTAPAPLRLLAPERCFYEPPPAARDVCLAVYEDESGARWYGRGDVTRTGVNGEKNYVDSYLTFQLLKRIEAERKGVLPRPTPAKKKGKK